MITTCSRKTSRIESNSKMPHFPQANHMQLSWAPLHIVCVIWSHVKNQESYFPIRPQVSIVHPQAWRLERFQIGCLALWSRDPVGGRWSKSILPRLEKKRFFGELNVSAERGATLWNSLTQSNSKISDSWLMGVFALTLKTWHLYRRSAVLRAANKLNSPDSCLSYGYVTHHQSAKCSGKTLGPRQYGLSCPMTKMVYWPMVACGRCTSVGRFRHKAILEGTTAGRRQKIFDIWYWDYFFHCLGFALGLCCYFCMVFTAQLQMKHYEITLFIIAWWFVSRCVSNLTGALELYISYHLTSTPLRPRTVDLVHLFFVFCLELKIRMYWGVLCAKPFTLVILLCQDARYKAVLSITTLRFLRAELESQAQVQSAWTNGKLREEKDEEGMRKAPKLFWWASWVRSTSTEFTSTCLHHSSVFWSSTRGFLHHCHHHHHHHHRHHHHHHHHQQQQHHHHQQQQQQQQFLLHLLRLHSLALSMDETLSSLTYSL